MISGQFTGEKISSNSSEAFSLLEKSQLGEKTENKVEYSYAEALFLVSEEKMEVFSGKKKLDFDVLIKKLKQKDKKIETKYPIFADLRKKGYIVKTALKYGAEFRVYEKGVKPGEEHARWILYCVKENDALNWYDFAAKNRIAHSTKKNLLIGLVDEEGDVTYYECRWTRP